MTWGGRGHAAVPLKGSYTAWAVREAHTFWSGGMEQPDRDWDGPLDCKLISISSPLPFPSSSLPSKKKNVLVVLIFFFLMEAQRLPGS